MTVLRDHQASGLRRFTAPTRVSAVADSTAPLLARIASLEATIEQLNGSLADAELDKGRREAAALAAGKSQAVIDDGARTRAVAAGMSAATHSLEEQLRELERLAGALAELGLEKLFGDAADHRTMVVETIHAAVARVRSSAVLRVSVSATDFSETAADELGVSLAPIPVAVEGGLKAGEARIALELGEIDLSLDGQWARLRAFLRTLGEEDA